MNIVKLDRKEIEEKIAHGNRFDGGYVLAVAPDGSEARMHWMQDNRQWDPWPVGWMVIGIPSLYPEGEGGESETAIDCLTDHKLDADEIEAEIEETREFDGIVSYCHAKFPDWMAASEEHQVAWLADAFLQACNGYGDDPAPWGTRGDLFAGDLETNEPLAEFEWVE